MAGDDGGLPRSQRGGLLGPDRFIPTPDAVIKVMLEAALKPVEVPAPAARRDHMELELPEPEDVRRPAFSVHRPGERAKPRR